MKNLTALIVVLLLSVSSLRAEQIFVLFDGACGDRVKYEQAIARQPRLDYFAYHFAFQGGDRLMLETGAEGSTVQNFLPEGYLYCGDPRLNLELANRVNGGIDRVFVLLPTVNNQFIVQPVIMASVLQRRGAIFSYFSPLTGYEFDIENGIIGENLAVNNEGAKVYFEGRETSPCSGYFLFRQLKPGASYPVIDYKISPEVGIFERRLGSDGVSTSGGTIIAREINGIPFASYLAGICTAATAINNNGQAPGPQPTVPAIQQPGQPQAYSNPQPESQAYNQPQPTISNITHTVAKGETLFSVSRKYRTSVDAIKAQNGLTSNMLFPGQQLNLTTTTTAQAPGAGEAVAMVPTVPTVPYNAGPVATSNPGAALPTPYGTSPATPQPYEQTSNAQAAVYGEDVHMVQPGETVASVALKYGYTSAKFREINELGPNQVIKVGQQLKTTACNCPAPAPVAPAPQEVAPAAYGQQAPAAPQAYGQPTAYGQQAPAAPQAYGQPAAPQYSQPATPQAYGNQQPSATATPAYRTPAGYQAPQASPVPAQTTTEAPAQTSITNNPNFGQVVPNVSAPASTSLSQLEARGTPAPTQANSPAPATYNAYPAPTSPAPQPYVAPQPVPNAYGTPVGVNAPAPAPAATNRSFHLVQEGESLYSIARRYGLTTDQLRALNNLDNGGVIVPFQKLYVN